jgi:hypothetical protein
VKAPANGKAKAPAKLCKPGEARKGKVVRPSCDAIEPSHVKPRGEALLRTRVAGIILVLVVVLGLIDAASVVFNGMQYQTPEKTLNDTTGDVYGRVTDTKGVGIGGADVSIIGTTHRASTDVDGWYFISSVPSRDYSVQVDKANYTSIIKSVKVEEQMPRPVNFQLSYGSGVKKADTRLPDTLGDLQPSYAYTAIAIVIGSIAAGLGALLSIKRSHFRTALLCAAVGTVSYGFLIGSILSLVALIIIVAARPGFVPIKASLRASTGKKTKVPAGDDGEVTLELGEAAVDEAEVKALGTRKAEQEMVATESSPKAPPEEEPIQDAEVKERLVSKGYESEGTVTDTDGDTIVKRRKREIRAVGPEVVGDMEKALKETMVSQEETETDIVASVLKKLELDKPVPSVQPIKEKPKKKRSLTGHQERFLCRECVKPIILESEAVRCPCGRTYHIHCARGIRECKNCGRRLKV